MLRNLVKLSIVLLSFCWINPTRAQGFLPDFTNLVEELMPTVVNITIDIDTNSIEFENGELSDEKKAPKISSGSGFIISNDGYIVTNKHVIDNAYNITVTTYNDQTYSAKIIGIDDKTDIALIKIDSKEKLKPVIFGDSNNIKVGEWIIAIGNPFGLGGSVTKGIVSAKSRDIDSGNYDNFIQTDASINRGNSGGPMFNMQGEIIGINTAIFSTSGGSMGIGFAIPMNLAKWVIEQLKENGVVKRGWVGVKIQPNTAEIAKSMGLNESQGIIVSGMTENAPAQKAGLKVGDIILSFDKIEIDNTKNLSRLIAETPIGKKSELFVWRAGKKFTLTITIEEMPIDKKQAQEKNEISLKNGDNTFIYDLGISLSNDNDSDEGLVVTDIISKYDAYKKGVKTGDIIMKIDKKTIFTIDDVKSQIQEAKLENNRPVLLQVKNNETTHFVAIELRKQ